MLSIQQMQYILALSEHKQFQKASESCFVTQPTLSMQVKKAEEMLGYPIFDRSRSPLELTVFGKSLIPIIREILSENDKIGTLAQKMKGEFREQIRIGIIPTVAAYMVPDLFSIWREKVPGILLMIEEQRTEELLESMERRSLDLAIMAGPHHDPALRTIPLFTEEILAFVPALSGKTVTTELLTELHPWLLSKGNCLRTQMISFCQLKEDASPDSWNYEGGNLELLLRMVEQEGGYSLVPGNYQLEKRNAEHLKHINAMGSHLVPAREIIALMPTRSIKKSAIEGLLREVQFKYNHTSDPSLKVIDWRG
jgi:LysR family hydrogen peroxide-inducible transcriptional activator